MPVIWSPWIRPTSYLKYSVDLYKTSCWGFMCCSTSGVFIWSQLDTLKMSRDSSIHSWPGSYYINSEKRWVSGTLSLSRTTLRFTTEQSKDSLASLRLSRIIEIKMESSSFIFSTLTVLEEGNIKHWFGSLRPNRVVVYNVLEHFWRERLLSPTKSHGAEAPLSKGRELISLVSGAQRRLEDAGKVLNHQGEQFDNVMQDLEKIDSNLDVADK